MDREKKEFSRVDVVGIIVVDVEITGKVVVAIDVWRLFMVEWKIRTG